MKILILHLSDIHIEKSSDIKVVNPSKIVASVNGLGNFKRIIILVSGDIAYSGIREQYEVAWELFGMIKSNFKARYGISPKIYIVPGNHDINYGSKSISHLELQELLKKRGYDSALPQQMSKQRNYRNFAYGNHCYDDNSPLLFREEIKFGDFLLEINLLNSAIFSSLDEDKGLHYMPQSVLDRLAEPTDADMAISVMHHSQHWFCNGDDVESTIFKKSALIFYGHEHKPEQYDIKAKGTNVKIVCGGELSNKGDWDQSTYNAILLDTDNYTYQKYEFVWHKKDRIYVPTKTDEVTLDRKPSRRASFQLKDSYVKSLNHDSKNSVSKDISDYFVFPRLEEVATSRIVQREFSTMEEFIRELKNEKKLEIVGYENSGKTTVLKQIFKEMSVNYAVLFCDMSNINLSTYRSFLRNTFEEMYSEDEIEFAKFEQTDKSEKVLILDNVDSIDARQFISFRQDMEKFFDYIICSSKNLLDLDLAERVKRDINEAETYKKYKILQFYADKRDQLVAKLVKIKVDEDAGIQDNIINALQDVLRKQRYLYNLDPDFIVKFTIYYCNNIKEASHNDGNIFSKVFEASLVTAIAPECKKILVDKVFIILDKIAYYIHSHKEYPLKQEKIQEIITWYNKEYDSDVSTQEFMRIVTDAKVLCNAEKMDEYVFCNKNYLAYFAAREIRRKCQEEQDYSDLERILSYACFGINANILLFVTYITDNMLLLRKILHKALEYTQEWLEFDIENVNIQYLSNIDPLELYPPSDEDKDQEVEKEIEKEKADIKKETIKAIKLYDYEESSIDKKIYQIIRAMSLMSVIARSLPSFEHLMLRSDKEQFVDTLYKLPNKIFHTWASEVEKDKEDILEEIKEMLVDNNYVNKKDKLKDEDIIKYLQWESVSLFLELINIVSNDATRENTTRYLEAFDYEAKMSYSFLHLMTISKRDKPDAFISETERIYDKNRSVIGQIMTTRIVQNYMIKSIKITQPQFQRLSNKYFKPMASRRILIERIRNAKTTQ